MKLRFLLSAFLAVVVVMAAFSLVPSCSPRHRLEAAAPTTVPDNGGPPGDKISRTLGGQFHSGIAVVGDTDETQLTVVGNATQTAFSLETQNSSGTTEFAVDNTGNISSTAITTVGSFLKLWPQVPITIAYGSDAINPTGSYQPIYSSQSAMGTSSITIKPAGTFLRMVNTGSNVITITDTGTIMLSGNIALGQYDTLTLISDGTNWIQIATSNN